jgi:hypothetical protein
MNKDNQLIFEAYKNRPLNEYMPYPTFAKLSKHASPKSSKEKPTDEFRQQMPDSKEEYSAHDYAKEMEARGENAESSAVHPDEKKYGELIKAREESEQRFKDWLKKQRAEGKAKNYPQKDENEERRLDPKCWKGYHKQGTKLKDGKRVNNCVKN